MQPSIRGGMGGVHVRHGVVSRPALKRRDGRNECLGKNRQPIDAACTDAVQCSVPHADDGDRKPVVILAPQIEGSLLNKCLRLVTAAYILFSVRRTFTTRVEACQQLT